MTGSSGSRTGAARSHDPHRDALYAAEHAALPDGGRRFRRFAEIEAYVTAVVTGPFWETRFPHAPIEVEVLRRSHGATFSAAHVTDDGDAAAVWLRDGSWDLATVVHELAHVAAAPAGTAAGGADPTGPHGERFATALLVLWRELLGVHAYGALRSCLDDHGVPYRRDRLG
jgi:putative metallohydrolase (TIGR04338 family)